MATSKYLALNPVVDVRILDANGNVTHVGDSQEFNISREMDSDGHLTSIQLEVRCPNIHRPTESNWVPPGWAVIGMKFRLTGRPTNPHLYHVRGFVDDQVVVRYWRKSRQAWEYLFLDEDWFLVNEKNVELQQ